MVGTGSTDGDPEELVEETQLGARMPPLQHGELLAKGQVLQDKIPTTTKEAKKQAEPEQQQVEPDPRL